LCCEIVRSGAQIFSSCETRHPAAFGRISEKLIRLELFAHVHGEGRLFHFPPSLVRQPQPVLKVPAIGPGRCVTLWIAKAWRFRFRICSGAVKFPAGDPVTPKFC
jgi:hypothetical protein